MDMVQRYQLHFGYQQLHFRAGHQLLSVGEQWGSIYIWVRESYALTTTSREIIVTIDGEPVPPDAAFVGTVIGASGMAAHIWAGPEV